MAQDSKSGCNRGPISLLRGVPVDQEFVRHLAGETEKLRQASLFKPQRVLTPPQSSVVEASSPDPCAKCKGQAVLGIFKRYDA